MIEESGESQSRQRGGQNAEDLLTDLGRFVEDDTRYGRRQLMCWKRFVEQQRQLSSVVDADHRPR